MCPLKWWVIPWVCTIFKNNACKPDFHIITTYHCMHGFNLDTHNSTRVPNEVKASLSIDSILLFLSILRQKIWKRKQKWEQKKRYVQAWHRYCTCTTLATTKFFLFISLFKNLYGWLNFTECNVLFFSDVTACFYNCLGQIRQSRIFYRVGLINNPISSTMCDRPLPFQISFTIQHSIPLSLRFPIWICIISGPQLWKSERSTRVTLRDDDYLPQLGNDLHRFSVLYFPIPPFLVGNSILTLAVSF